MTDTPFEIMLRQIAAGVYDHDDFKAFSSDLRSSYKIGDEFHTKIFNFAWDNGHSSGLMAVLDIYDDLSELATIDTRANPAADKMAEALEQCEEYFDNRADAEYFTDSPSPVANEEMEMLITVRAALAEYRGM